MPHLIFAGRYWRVAGDEFSVPALCSIVGRVFWTALLLVTLALSYNNLVSCSSGWLFVSYLLISIGSFALSVMCDTALVGVSLKGSIIETEKREDIGFYLRIKILLGFFQLILGTFGVISLILESTIPCNNEFEGQYINQVFVAIVVASQLIDVLVMCCCCYLFSANKIDHEIEPRDEDWALNTWESRCRKLTRSIQTYTCNLFGGGNIQEGFEEVAKVLTVFFHHDGFLDVVPSDVFAGIILVRVEQRGERQAELDSILSECSGVFIKSVHNPAALHVEESIEHDLDIERKADELKLRTKSSEMVPTKLEPTALSSGVITSDEKIKKLKKHASTLNSFTHERVNDIELLETLARNSVFALAIYTHLILIYMKPCTGLCKLCVGGCCQPHRNPKGKVPPFCRRRCFTSCFTQSIKCCCCCFPCVDNGGPHEKADDIGPIQQHYGSSYEKKKKKVPVVGDNFMGLHHVGMSIIMDHLEDTELLFVSYRNDTFHKPYAVFLDHLKEQVVITIRGTLSLEDCITDAICDPCEMSEVGKEWGFDGTGRWAHAGMLKAANSIRMELETSNILSKIFGGSASPSTIETPLTEARDYSTYKLTITGHSLGAGTAVLLTMLLRPAYPRVRCYSYGTPGSILDRKSCEDVREYCISVVLSNDLVCRLGVVTLNKLRNDVLDAISRAKVNKMHIMQAIFKDFKTEDLMYARGEEPDTPFRRSIAKFKDSIDDKIESTGDAGLFLPGRIIHFVKSENVKKCCFNVPTYIPVESSLDKFRSIQVSTTMGADHFPDRYFYDLHTVLDFCMKQMTV